jgi:hypothetical protein
MKELIKYQWSYNDFLKLVRINCKFFELFLAFVNFICFDMDIFVWKVKILSTCHVMWNAFVQTASHIKIKNEN